LDRNAEVFSDKTIRESDFQKLDREIKKQKKEISKSYIEREREILSIVQEKGVSRN
jgi:predicted small secreted protein